MGSAQAWRRASGLDEVVLQRGHACAWWAPERKTRHRSGGEPIAEDREGLAGPLVESVGGRIRSVMADGACDGEPIRNARSSLSRQLSSWRCARRVSREMVRRMVVRNASVPLQKVPPTAASPGGNGVDTADARSLRLPSPASRAASASLFERAHLVPSACRSASASPLRTRRPVWPIPPGSAGLEASLNDLDTPSA